jgi:hypothetical protein
LKKKNDPNPAHVHLPRFLETLLVDVVKGIDDGPNFRTMSIPIKISIAV